MASKIRKQVTLTMTIEDATKLDKYIEDNTHINFSGLLKRLVFEYAFGKSAENALLQDNDEGFDEDSLDQIYQCYARKAGLAQLIRKK